MRMRVIKRIEDIEREYMESSLFDKHVHEFATDELLCFYDEELGEYTVLVETVDPDDYYDEQRLN